MAYNRIRSCKFFIDAVLLARQFGCIETENSDGLFYLNPTKKKNFDIDGTIFKFVKFKNRYFINSLTHIFYFGHDFYANNISFRLKSEGSGTDSEFFGNTTVQTNGWHFESFSEIMDVNNDTLTAVFTGDANPSFNISDMSVGWSYEMPHSPDMELTQSMSNESLKTQTTKGGVTLTNTGWNHQPYWGSFPAWARGTAIPGTAFHSSVFGGNIFSNGRRSWNLKFSYVSDEDLFPSALHDSYGIFVKINDDSFSIKDNFASKVLPTINLGLPFIFQPDSTVEEYAIVRANSDSVTFNQVANNVYDVSMSLTETF